MVAESFAIIDFLISDYFFSLLSLRTLNYMRGPISLHFRFCWAFMVIRNQQNTRPLPLRDILSIP